MGIFGEDTLGKETAEAPEDGKSAAGDEDPEESGQGPDESGEDDDGESKTEDEDDEDEPETADQILARFGNDPKKLAASYDKLNRRFGSQGQQLGQQVASLAEKLARTEAATMQMLQYVLTQQQGVQTPEASEEEQSEAFMRAFAEDPRKAFLGLLQPAIEQAVNPLKQSVVESGQTARILQEARATEAANPDFAELKPVMLALLQFPHIAALPEKPGGMKELYEIAKTMMGPVAGKKVPPGAKDGLRPPVGTSKARTALTRREQQDQAIKNSVLDRGSDGKPRKKGVFSD